MVSPAIRQRLICYPTLRLGDHIPASELRAPWKPDDLWTMTPAARALHTSRASLKGILGGVGSAKSVTITREAIFAGFENLGHVGALFEPTIPLVRDVLQPTMEASFEAMGLRRGEDWTFHKTEWAWRVLGGAERGGFTILGRPASEWERIVGMNLAWAGADELARMEREAMDHIFDRVRVGPAPRKFFGTTPYPGSWVVKWMKSPPASAFIIKARTLDNPFMTQGYLDDLAERHDPASLAAYLEGEAVTLTGNAYPQFKRAAWPDGNILSHVYKPTLPVHISTDNNINPKPVILAQAVGDRLAFFAEAMVYGGSARSCAEAVHARLGGVAPRGFALHGDPTDRHISSKSDSGGWGWYADFRDELIRLFGRVNVQLQVPDGAGLEIARVAAVNSFLCNGAGKRIVTIDPACVHLIGDVEAVQVDDSGKLRKPGGHAGKGIEKGVTDPTDAIGYFIVGESDRRAAARQGRPVFASAELSLRP